MRAAWCGITARQCIAKQCHERGKPKGFFYLDHRTVDGRCAIITGTHVTPANVHDSIPYLARPDRQRGGFGFDVRAVGLDAAPIAKCRDCPLLASCSSNAQAQKTVTRHVWADARERVDAHRLTDWGKALYKRRKETIERSFADAKQRFGHCYACFRSLAKAQSQALLAATARNIKKIAMAAWNARPRTA